MSRELDIQKYLKALSKALCARYPIDYPTILGIAQDKYMQLDNDGRLANLSDFRPLLRRAIINAVIDEARKAKKRNERELPYAIVFGDGAEEIDVDTAMAESCGDDTHANNPPEQCDWKDFVNTVLTRSERMMVDLITEMPEAFAFAGNSVKELRGAMRRYLKLHGMPERKFWLVQDELKRKLSERTGVRRAYNG